MVWWVDGGGDVGVVGVVWAGVVWYVIGGGDVGVDWSGGNVISISGLQFILIIASVDVKVVDVLDTYNVRRTYTLCHTITSVLSLSRTCWHKQRHTAS